MSQTPPSATRPRGAPVRPGAPARGGAAGGGAPGRSGPARSGAPGPRPRVSAATYWRRRIVVFGAGAGLITTLTWAVNGLIAGGPPPSQAATGGHTTAERHTKGRHHQHHNVSPAPSPSPSPSPTPSHAPARHRHRNSSGKPAQVSGSTAACAAGGVTLTVTTQAWYQTGTTPRFAVHAVSSQSQPCSFNMSPRAVAVVIETSRGRSVWNSADCASGPASRPVVLADGTHAALHVSWDRRTGCGDAGNLVLPGEYRATAAVGSDKSASVNFVLGAKGSTGP